MFLNRVEFPTGWLGAAFAIVRQSIVVVVSPDCPKNQVSLLADEGFNEVTAIIVFGHPNI
jgi:hypothetical protein